MMIAKESDARSSQYPPTPDPALKQLDVLVGTWHSEGKTIPNGEIPILEIKGTDIYEWLPGEFFLVHRVDVVMGDQQANVIEIIGGYDPSNENYPMRSFDNQGKVGLMQASVNQDGIWTFAGESERATLTIGAVGNTMTATLGTDKRWVKLGALDGYDIYEDWVDRVPAINQTN